MTRASLFAPLITLLIGVFFISDSVSAQTSCALGVGGAYKTQTSNAVWAVTEGCQKRPILNPAVFFSHYSSWDDVQVVSQASLDAVPRHPLNFLPWGPLRALDNGSLIKTVDDPNVYLKLGNRLHTFTDEAAFYAFGYSFADVEDVTAEVIAQHTIQSPIAGIDSAPEGLVFKYPNAPQVYRLEKRASDGKIVKRHIRTYDEFQQIYRTNLLVDLPLAAVFEDLTSSDTSTTDDTNQSSNNTTDDTSDATNSDNASDSDNATNDTTSNTDTDNTGNDSQTSSETTSGPGAGTSGSGADVTNPSSSGSSVGITSPYTTVSVSPLSDPVVGESVIDPTFGVAVRKLAAGSGSGFRRHIYSQLQAFNADNSLVMLQSAGDVGIYDVSSGSKVYTLPGDINSPRWNPVNKDEVFFYDSNDVGSQNTLVRFQRHNIVTGETKTVVTLDSRYQTVAPAQSWEEISRDGVWTAAMLRRADGGTSFAMINIAEGRLGAELDRESLGDYPGCNASDNDINWIAPSPLGNYMVIQWNRDGNTRCEGVEVRNIETGAYIGHVSDNRQHSDMGLDESGNEIYVSPYFGSSLFVATTKLPGSTNFSANYEHIIADVGWYHFGHISCKGPQGVCVVSGEGAANDAFGAEIYLLYTNGRAADNEQNDGARVRRLAHHRSTNRNYWAQPQPSFSADGSYIIFASNWGQNGSSVDSYLIDLRNSDISAPQPVGNTAGNANATSENNTNTNTSEESESTNTDSTTNNTSTETEATNNSLGAEIDLAANGLPNSTYAAQGSDGNFTLGTWFGRPAEKDYVELLTINYLGAACSNVDFANIRFFIQANQTGTYTRIEPGSYLATGDSGCGMKSNVRTVVSLPAGTHNIVACAANDDFSNNYCTDSMPVSTNPDGQTW